MPENSPETIHAPQFPANHQNEPIPASENSSENSRFEKIVNAGERVFAKFGIVKPGRGRPRKDGQPKKSDMVQPAISEPLPAGGNAPLQAVNSDITGLFERRCKMFASGCLGLLKGAVSGAKYWTRNQAVEARIDAAFVEKTLAAATPEEKDYEEWREACELCAHQYKWDFEHMPAIHLGAKTIGIFAPFAMLANDFKKEIARQRAKDEAAQPKETK